MKHQLKIGLLIERRYLAQTQPNGMMVSLCARGHQVVLLDPQASYFALGQDDWLDGLDLIVARGRSWALFSLLAWAESCGVPTVNSRAAIGAVHNKSDMAVALAAGAVPTPHTMFGAVEQLARQAPCSSYPLILKPIFGDNSRGLRVVQTRDELAQVEWPEPVALAQHFLPSDGYDLKLYGVGDEIWAVRKPAPDSLPRALFGPARADRPRAELLPVTPELHALGRRCGAIFGLELFGVDCIETPRGPVVIEVNDFPNYTGVPEADERLADYIAARALAAGPRLGRAATDLRSQTWRQALPAA